MRKLALATMVALSLVAAPTADARPLLGNFLAAAAAGAAAAAASALTDCEDGPCPRNGPHLTGMALETTKAKQPIVNAVTLPSGETVVLR